MLSYAFCLLLLGTFAYCDKTPPPYLQAQIDISDALDILKEQVVSMDGHIPLLNDSRRHYAEFVHVIFNIAVIEIGCARPDYGKLYQVHINKLVSESLHDPYSVINEVREQTEAFLKCTNVIRELIRDECLPVGFGAQTSDSHRCDAKVQQHVDDVLFPKSQVKVLLAAGKAAQSFLEKHQEFLAASKDHGATQYIVHGDSKLKGVIMDFAGYLKVLRKSQANDCM